MAPDFDAEKLFMWTLKKYKYNQTRATFLSSYKIPTKVVLYVQHKTDLRHNICESGVNVELKTI